MDYFLFDTVFNTNLEGKAVRIKGNNSESTKVDDLFLVNAIDNEDGKIYAVDKKGRFNSFHYTDFTHKNNPLKLVILK